MKISTFKTQYRTFRMLTARFFSYWFFIIFASLGVAIAVVERFANVLGVGRLEPLMILILSYTTLVYIVTERAKVLDDIHENIRSAKAKVYPTRESVYMAVPLIGVAFIFAITACVSSVPEALIAPREWTTAE